MDDNLSWCYHIKHDNSKISRALFTINQAKHLLSPNCMLTLYYSMIHPYLAYGLLAWGNYSKSLLNHTLSLQKKAVRIISKAHFDSHTDPIFKQLNILKLTDLYEYEMALFMMKYARNKLPCSFNGLFPTINNKLGRSFTRQSQLLHVKFSRTDFSGRFLIFKFPRLWNEWCCKIPNYDYLSVNQFKYSVKRILVASYMDMVHSAELHLNKPVVCTPVD